MNRLQMATLLSWAGTKEFEGRKRLQKVIYLLQQAGCPLECQYILHHFGPYSRDVAATCDEMVAAGLIEEHEKTNAGMVQYSYALATHTREFLEHTTDEQMKPYEGLGEQLINEQMWTLELGSTILFFHAQCQDWQSAMTEACKFKNVDPDVGESQPALALAKRVKGLKPDLRV